MATLLEMTLTGGVMILLVLLLRAIFLNRLPKTAFIVMWAVVLLRLLVPVSFFGTATASTESPEVYTLESVTPTEETEVREVITLDSYNPSTEPVAETTGHSDIFRTIWLVGAVICGIALALSYILSIRRFNKSENLETDFISSFQSSNKLRRTVTVKLSDKTTTPLTYGIIHPVILLPEGMDLSDQKQLKYVLMHEYIHIRKLDNLLKGISSAAVCIHWFNPLVWVMNRFLSRDIELRCDEALLRQCQGDCRADYALTLIDLEDKRRGYAPAATAFAMRASEERIVAIMKYQKLTPSSVLAMILCITLLCTALVGCGAVSTAEQTTEATATTEATTEPAKESEAEEISGTDSGSVLTIRFDDDIRYAINSGELELDFSGIEFASTLPGDMYISAGTIYNADGVQIGTLEDIDGYESMVIDGTGEVADGYTFIVIDYVATYHDSESSDETDPEEVDTLVINSVTQASQEYHPIYSDFHLATVYELLSSTVSGTYIKSESTETDESDGNATYYVYAASANDKTVSAKVIYLVSEDDMNEVNLIFECVQ
ncbi:MAG: M56 family metallopeptidase [Oscillospiraceae bacterium]|nr:M56 family metallopeptidase [Oscillospiraceae bacterium]